MQESKFVQNTEAVTTEKPFWESGVNPVTMFEKH